MNVKRLHSNNFYKGVVICGCWPLV